MMMIIRRKSSDEVSSVHVSDMLVPLDVEDLLYRDHIDYLISRYRSQIRRACDNRGVHMSYDIIEQCKQASTPSVGQCRTAIIISTTVISCRLKGPE